MSYHNGSVWPHDNALIALGLARYGLKNEMFRILTGLAEAGTHFERQRLPELFCGFRRRTRSGPVAYPVACSPQAWAAATPYALLQACLGLTVDPARNEVCLTRPWLPPWLDHLAIHDIRVNDRAVTLSVDRSADSVMVRAVGPSSIKVAVDK